MKVYNLSCAHGHRFEGWFASDDDYGSQQERGLLECPLCEDRTIQRMPSAPRLNLSGAQSAPVKVTPTAEAAGAAAGPTKPEGQPVAHSPELQAIWMQAMRQLVARTEDVGDRFAEEARRIHYGESEERGIRGRASREDAEALRDEGIEVMALPLPAALKGPLQ